MRVRMNWRFITHDARVKLKSFYPRLLDIGGLLRLVQLSVNEVNQ
jgi:hypothetical protein